PLRRCHEAKRKGAVLMLLDFDTASMDDYAAFLRLKQTPAYSWRGLRAEVPDEYAHYVTGRNEFRDIDVEYDPSPFCFDYQRDITRMAIQKRKFATFAQCGLGKTIVQLEFARH